METENDSLEVTPPEENEMTDAGNSDQEADDLLAENKILETKMDCQEAAPDDDLPTENTIAGRKQKCLSTTKNWWNKTKNKEKNRLLSLCVKLLQKV